jgi:GAF domain-containing protein
MELGARRESARRLGVFADASRVCQALVAADHGVGLPGALWRTDMNEQSGADLDLDLVEAFVSLQSLVLTSNGVEDFLAEVTTVAAGLSGPFTSCGITARRDGRPVTVASSDDRALRIDQVQYDHREGPCLATLATGEVNDVADLTADDRWPGYRQEVLRAGLRCSLSLPLTAGGRTAGALNLYGFGEPGLFGPLTRRRADLFAAQASTALTLMIHQLRQSDVTRQLEHALDSRSVIDQALGIMMAQQHCTAEEAFTLLRLHSQNNNRKLRDVATELVERVTGRAPVPGRRFQRGAPPA